MQHTSMAEQPQTQTHYVANAGNAERERGLVPVRWVCPGRRYDGVVHLVSAALVDTAGPGGRVTVWWPNRTRGKPWQGIRLDVPGELYMCS